MLAPTIASTTSSASVTVVSRYASGPAKIHSLPEFKVILPLAGAVDVDQEKARLGREKRRLEQDLEGVRRKLGNDAFMGKAPPAVVEKERGRLAELETRLARIAADLAGLDQ